jgi:hypothetical protein
LIIGHACEAEVTLEHDTPACEVGQKIQIDTNTGLALGDVPGAHGPALGAAHAAVRINEDCSTRFFSYSTKGTQRAAGGIVAVHAPALNVQIVDLSVVLYGDLLNIGPVVWSQSSFHISLGTPVLVLCLGPVVLHILVTGLRIAGLIFILAGGDTPWNRDI